MNHAIYFLNRVTSHILNKLPYYLLFNEEHDLHVLKVFGTLAYTSTIQSHTTKLDYKGRKCVFLGFKLGVKGAILIDTNDDKNFIQEILSTIKKFPYKLKWHYHSTIKT